MTVLALGITLNLTGTTLSALGLLRQKLAHLNKNNANQGCCPGAYFCSTQWLSGFGVFVAGHIVCVTAMALCPMTVLACLNCLTMVVAVVLGAVVLKEPVTHTRFTGVVILCLACMWVVSYAPEGRPYLTGEMVKDNFRRPLFLYLIPAALLFGGIAAILAGYITRNDVLEESGEEKARLVEENGENLCSSSGTWRVPWASSAVLAATCAWYSTIGAKSLVGLGFTTVYFRQTQFYSLAPIFIALTTIVAVTGNVHFLNLALQRGPMNTVMPLYEATSVLGQVCIGGAFFGELPTNPAHCLSFFARVAVVIGAMFLLSIGPKGKALSSPSADSSTGRARD